MALEAVKALGAQVGLRTKNFKWAMKEKMKAHEPVGPHTRRWRFKPNNGVESCELVVDLTIVEGTMTAPVCGVISKEPLGHSEIVD